MVNFLHFLINLAQGSENYFWQSICYVGPAAILFLTLGLMYRKLTHKTITAYLLARYLWYTCVLVAAWAQLRYISTYYKQEMVCTTTDATVQVIGKLFLLNCFAFFLTGFVLLAHYYCVLLFKDEQPSFSVFLDRQIRTSGLRLFITNLIVLYLGFSNYRFFNF